MTTQDGTVANPGQIPIVHTIRGCASYVKLLGDIPVAQPPEYRTACGELRTTVLSDSATGFF